MSNELRAIAGYQIEGKISAGGMGTVYRASRRGRHGFSKRVAIKIVHDDLLGQPEVQALFVDEARLAAQLSHPNICQVFDFGAEGDTYYLVMEYVPGHSLVDIIRAQRLRRELPPPQLAARVIADAARGLHHAHELRSEHGALLNVVHRDVSPENIRVTPDGTTKVLDFGIARWAERLTVTRQSVIRGKLAYMSPEQVRSEPLDRRADIFALGVVMHELLTCRPLFPRDDAALTMNAVEQLPIPDLRAIVPGMPPGLAAVAERALARDPAARFQSAEELTVEIEHVLAQLGRTATAEALAHHLQLLAATLPASELLALDAAVETGDDSAFAATPAATSDATVTVRARLPVHGLPRQPTEVVPEQELRLAPTLAENAVTDKLPAPGRAARWRRPGALIALATAGLLLALVVSARVRSWWTEQRPAPPVAAGIDAAAAMPTPAIGAASRIADAASATAGSDAAERALDRGATGGRERTDPVRSRSRPQRTVNTGHTAAEVGRGTISVYAHPWGNVRIDGKLVGPTPLRRVELAAGHHRIEIVAPDTDQVRAARDVTVATGAHQDITVRDR